MSDSARLKLIYQVIEIANSSIDLRERQEQILDAIVRALNIKEAVLFLQNHQNKAFVPSFSSPREFMTMLPIMWYPSRELINSIMLHHQPILLNQMAYDDKVLKLLNQRGIVLLLPIFDDSNFYGMLALVGYEPPQVGDGIMLKTVARAIAGMVRNFANYRESRKRITELSLLADIGKVGVSTMQVERLLQTTIDLVCRFLGASFGVIGLKGPADEFVARYGRAPADYHGHSQCWLACRNSGQEVNHIRQVLPFQGQYQGFICLFDKYPTPDSPAIFNMDDRRLLSIMSNMLAPAIENAMNFRHVQLLAESNAQMVGALGMLYEIGNHLLISTSLRRRIMVALGALAHQDSFGFSRAAFFAADQEKGVLESRAMLHSHDLNGSLAECLAKLVRLAPEKLMDTYGIKPAFSFQLAGRGNFLTNALKTNKFVLLNKPAANAGQELLNLMGDSGPWIALPLASRGQGVGVILLAGRPDARPVDTDQQHLLKMLCDQVEMALEGSLTLQNLRKAHQELAGMQTRLLEADRLAGLGEIVSGMAHEIRNPMMIIGGFARRVRKNMDDNDPNAPYMDKIIEQVRRVEALLAEMLSIPYDGSENFQIVNMADILDKSMLLMGELLDNIEIIKEYKPNLPPVYADERLLKQAFFNILTNALQAMDNEGRLIVRTRLQLIDDKLMVGGEVEDSGGGIPLQAMHKVFEPFFTTKGQGSGLGLSYVHKIVTSHEGSIEVHNQGAGAAFVIYLPARPL